MVKRKQGISAVSVFCLYYKTSSQYSPSDYSHFAWKRTKEIKDKNVERQIEIFLSNYKEAIFSNSLSEIEDYFQYCFLNKKQLYFFNLSEHIESWKKHEIKNPKDELKYVFADKVINYLEENNLDFLNYLKCQKNYIPKILQHYLAIKEIPFEVLLYLKIFDKCQLDKRKLKMMLSKEFYDMKDYEKKLERLKPLISNELKKILEWSKRT